MNRVPESRHNLLYAFVCINVWIWVLAVHPYQVPYYVESYGMNSRGIHPNGIPPNLRKARANLQFIEKTIQRMASAGASPQKTSNTSTSESESGANPLLILIDGNNIRNSWGYQSLSASDLTSKASDWSSSSDAVMVFWDGGSGCEPSSFIVSDDEDVDGDKHAMVPTLAPDVNADDVMVQTCAFLSKYAHESHEVVVFTSDANLANRCKEMHVKSSHIFHSIYLCLLLGATDADLQERIFEEEWERSERRRSVEELQIRLGKENQFHDADARDALPITRDLHEWINNGRPNLEIGRVTKGGSILYQIVN